MRIRPSAVVAYLSIVIICIFFARKILIKRPDNEATLQTLDDLKKAGELVQNRCRGLHGTDLPTSYSGQARKYGMMLVDHRYKLLYCLVPKVASSNAYRVFLVLGKHVVNTDPATITSPEINVYKKNITLLARMTKTDTQRYLKSYTKVMFSRNPFDRLLSAYHSKIEIGGDAHSRRVKQDVVNSLKIVSKMPLNNITVTFPMFVRYLFHLKDSKRAFDQHWATVENICDPCHVHYDYVGDYDNVEVEMNAILKAVGADRSIRFPTREATMYEPSEMVEQRLKKHYQDVPYDHIKKLQDLYARDVLLFGHRFPQPLKQIYNKHLLPDHYDG